MVVPRARGVQRQLERADTAMAAAERVLTALPIRGRQAQLAARIEERHALAKRALGYVTLYGAYTETDARYRVDNLLALWGACDEADHERFGFDPGVIDWDHYVYDVHFPSVLEHARVRTKPGRSVVEKRPDASAAPSWRPNASWPCSTSSTRSCPPTWWTPTPGWPAGTSRRRAGLVSWPSSSARDRRCWRSTGATGVTSCAPSTCASKTRRSSSCGRTRGSSSTASCSHARSPTGFARVRAHRAAGHRTLLITGALDFIIEPIRPLFDDIVCAAMEARDGRLTGHLSTLPPIGEARALLLHDYAEEYGLSLEESVAYADSASDLAMLEAVGFPVAVNPESRLSAIARRRGWHVEHWAKAEGGSHRALPLGPFDVKSPKAVMGR